MHMLQIFCCCLLIISQAKGDCDADVDEYIAGLSPSNPKLWAIEMFDSATKAPSDGIAELTVIVQPANFEECIAIRGPPEESGNPRFKGQYCIYRVGFSSDSPASSLLAENGRDFTIQKNVMKYLHKDYEVFDVKADDPAFPLPLLWAVCTPSTCGAEGAKRIADFNLQFLSQALGGQSNVTVWPNTCYYENDPATKLDAASWGFLGFFLVLLLFIGYSTITHLYWKNSIKQGWLFEVTKAFSLTSTWKDLSTLPKIPGYLGCVHGIRVLSLGWIILCHNYFISAFFPTTNTPSFFRGLTKQWFAAPLLNAYVAVDTFFFLSGLLTSYVPLNDHAKGRKFNIFKYYIYRYLRISVPFAVVLWYLSSIVNFIGIGPLWRVSVRGFWTVCRDNWWASLLYINNYFFAYCVGPAWYLNVDMQLAFLAPAVLIPLMKWPKYGLAACGLLSLASMAAVFGLTYVEGLPWTSVLITETSKYNRFSEVIYENTPMRAAPYFIGIAFGYVMSRKITFPLPNWGVVLGWIAALGVNATVVFSILIPYKDEYVYNALESAFYSSFHRVAWTLALCWIIWACANGFGGFINRMLTWKYYVPLSKLTREASQVSAPELVFSDISITAMP